MSLDGTCERCGRTEDEILRRGAVLTWTGGNATVLVERDGRKVCQMPAIVWCDIVSAGRKQASTT